MIREIHAKCFFDKLLEKYNVSQLIIHNASWSEVYVNDEGKFCEFNDLKSIRKHNQLLENYYKFVTEYYPGIRMISASEKHRVSSPNHKWGLSPIHFIDDYYIELLENLKNIDLKHNFKLLKTKFGDVNIMDRYDSKYCYLDFGVTSNVKKNKTLKFDSNGIPQLSVGKSGEIGYQYDPITIAFYGLELISKYYYSNEIELKEEFINICNYFLGSQCSDGSWKANFDYYYGVKESGVCRGPWSSALAQGTVISCLVRAYIATGEIKFRGSH